MKTFYGSRTLIILALAALIFCAVSIRTYAEELADTDGALILERANSNENIYNSATGDFTSHLRGDVVFRFEDVRLSADEATWLRTAGIIDFYKNVKVEQRGQVMTGNRINFNRDKNLVIATGNVLYQDSAKITFIRGNTAEYMTDKKECLLKGDPLLTRIDSTDADTLFIRGVTMTYNDSTKIATVERRVNILKGDLNATSERGVYFADSNKAIMRIRPVINYEKHRVKGDSVDLFFGKESLSGACVMGNTHGYYYDVADSTKDTTVTNIWSDSLYLSMYKSGKVESIKAFGGARGDYSETTAASGNRVTTNITSDSMHMFMFETGKVSAMKAFANARGDYSEITASSGNRVTTNITSDSMHMFMFETGKISAMKAFVNARGKYSEFTPSANSAMSTDITSDSMHVFMFETGKISAMKAFGSAHGRSAEFAGSAQAMSSTSTEPPKDSTITHIWGDSLRVTMSDAGNISAMRAFGSVTSKNFVLGDSARASEVSGQRMTLTFGGDGKIDRAVVRGDAKSTYFLEDSDGGGVNKAGGDMIVVIFSRGKAQRLLVRGKAKGIYVP